MQLLKITLLQPSFLPCFPVYTALGRQPQGCQDGALVAWDRTIPMNTCAEETKLS